MPTSSVSIHAGKFPLFPVRIHVQFWLALDAHKFSKELQQTFYELPIKQFCLIDVGYVDISDLFQGPKSEIKSILVTQIILQNSVRIHATKFSKELWKRDSVVLLVVKTLSIRGSLYIWYSLQITLHLRGATPTNRHPLQICGFSIEILSHSCLEVVMNL